MKLHVLHHAATEENEANICRGWMDVPLSDLGFKQAAILADHYERARISKIFTSDMKRCAQTAFEIAKRHPMVDLVWTPRLRSINMGDFQGKPYKEIEAQIDGLRMAWQDQPDIKAPGGESWSDFQNRLYPFLNETAATAGEDEEIMLVTHSHVCAYAAALAFSGGRPLFGADLAFMRSSTTAPGNSLILESFRPLRLVGLNTIRQITEGLPT